MSNKRARNLSDESSEDDATESYRPRKYQGFGDDMPSNLGHKQVNQRAQFDFPQNDEAAQSTSSSDENEREGMSYHSFSDRVQSLMKPASESTFENSVVQRMLDKMGHQKGKGLGKNAQGRVAPIELSTQRGRQGLGFSVKGLEAATLEWDFSSEVVNIQEDVHWLEEKDHMALESSELSSWMREGPRKLEIEDELEFCHPEVLRSVLNYKSVFDELSAHEMRKARMRSNPFETIRGGIFLNRAAMKMANMDAVFDFMFTNPVDEFGNSMVGDGLLYFADVCAGPGGFSEYVLWRKEWEAKGFGFTLKGENDFRLSDFLVGPSESFETHYGVNGLEGDGDVMVEANIREFSKYVHERTRGEGVHFMMADGGFSVESQENIQEILSKQLYLCQFLVALCIVREGGHFVCKVFDLFTPFSVGLIYLLYKAFKKISIHKPNTSRPANSERYVICKWKRDDCSDIRDYMSDINARLWKLHNSDRDVVEVVPMDLIKSDADFMDYIVESNNSLGARQAINLAKITAFCKDTNLMDLRQAEMRTGCLEYWNIPDKPRKLPTNNPNEKLRELLQENTGWMTEPEKVLNEKVLKECILSSYDWRCFVVANREEDPKLTFYLGLGQGKVYCLQLKSRGKAEWCQVVELKVELSPGTLILGETLQEHQGEGRCQQRVRALHIIDAFFLGKTDLRKKHLKERNSMCLKFVKSMNRPLRSDLAMLRVKTLYRSSELKTIFNRLEKRTMKSSSAMERLAYNLEGENSKYIIPSGVMFIKETKDPWIKTLNGRDLCWLNITDNQVKKDIPPDSIADLKCCFRSRLMWRWNEDLHNFDPERKDEHNPKSGLDGLSDIMRTSVLLTQIGHVSSSYRPSHHRHSSAHGSGHARHVQH